MNNQSVATRITQYTGRVSHFNTKIHMMTSDQSYRVKKSEALKLEADAGKQNQNLIRRPVAASPTEALLQQSAPRWHKRHRKTAPQRSQPHARHDYPPCRGAHQSLANRAATRLGSDTQTTPTNIRALVATQPVCDQQPPGPIQRAIHTMNR